ncbi:Methanogenic corrinoid protein MtbC1 [Desulfacinum infernum DSM 9756]|uniref:Methanogenic corrinoid protein MtbC1 n=1 Tax=Desulfacinum infernum DSM 9756 TaxID=1121391 RepID=A0A1M5G6T9_9BACT|nr:cobalamin-dependent protein [Desulfacinum infernum]SHF99530.1 Methanogenic corrinoid protein MtbC1 [Desulfacinum infernum DSM 9756]
MSDLKALTDTVVEMKETEALELTVKLLESGVAARDVFRAYQDAMSEIGKRFEQQVYFLPELIMAGDMMQKALEVIRPHLVEGDQGGGAKIGKFLIATVAGDIHDIGKNIVTMLMDINGFEVRDLGVDVPADRIVEEAKAFGPDVVGLSGLLTLAYDPMKEVVEKLEAAGLRQNLKVIIGGAQMDESVRTYVGADAFATDAVVGVNLCKEWVN